MGDLLMSIGVVLVAAIVVTWASKGRAASKVEKRGLGLEWREVHQGIHKATLDNFVLIVSYSEHLRLLRWRVGTMGDGDLVANGLVDFAGQVPSQGDIEQAKARAEKSARSQVGGYR